MADPIVNFFKSTLVGTYSNTATSFTIATGDGALLPDPSTDGEFNLVVYEGTAGIAASTFEIVRVTAKSGDVLTVTREQENTTALTIGSETHSIILSATKKTFDDKANTSGASLSNVESITFTTDGDGVLELPKGTFAQRPSSPATGYTRYNTEAEKIEFYDGTIWKEVTTGSEVTEPIEVEYLVIAGGGGGGGGNAGSEDGGGGGGGGGYRSSVSGESSGGGASAESVFEIELSTNYTVTIGAGGSAGSVNGQGGDGSNSVLNAITSTGGGGGGCNSVGRSGGSGGGGSQGSGGTATASQGYNGGSSPGYYGGGGGGAGQVGSNGSVSPERGGKGGDGVSSSITGSATYRGGGGGGARWYYGSVGAGGLGGGGSATSTTGVAGTTNTGGGGGGGSVDTSFNGRVGGAGGSGVVILKYPDTYTITVGAGLTSSTTSSGGFKVTTFTAGDDTISFS